MREIEFRAKQDNKWFYGCYVNQKNKHVIFEKESTWHHYIDENTLGQYTGLCDKNGTKIFEGDIVRISDWFIDVVIFTNGCFCMKEQIMHYEFTYQDFETIEVIGNIHDNPELLGGTDEDNA